MKSFDSQEQLNGLQSLQKVVIICLLDGGESQVMNLHSNLARISEEQNTLVELKSDDSLDVFSKLFANGMLDEDNTRISDGKKKCIQVSQFFDNSFGIFIRKTLVIYSKSKTMSN